jgi:serine/threonine protein kinase
MAQLSHPNVVGVHAPVAWAGRVVLAMELVEGTSLGRWLEEGVPEWREVIDVLAAAGRGLAAAHDAGLVHRDFKAQSVGTDGRVRVTDLGQARPIVEPCGRDGRARRVYGPPSAAAAEGIDGDRVEARIREVAASRGEHHEKPRDQAPGSHQRAGGDRGAQGGARHHHGTGSSMTTKASRHLKREESVSLAWRRVLKDGPSAQPGVLDSAHGTRALAATARVLPANTVWNEWVAAETLTNLAHLSSTMGVQGKLWNAGLLGPFRGPSSRRHGRVGIPHLGGGPWRRAGTGRPLDSATGGRRRGSSGLRRSRLSPCGRRRGHGRRRR